MIRVAVRVVIRDAVRGVIRDAVRVAIRVAGTGRRVRQGTELHRQRYAAEAAAAERTMTLLRGVSHEVGPGGGRRGGGGSGWKWRAPLWLRLGAGCEESRLGAGCA